MYSPDAYVFLFVLVRLVLLAAGAERLVRGSSTMELRIGITPLVRGLTVVAFATGSPGCSSAWRRLTAAKAIKMREDISSANPTPISGCEGEL
jgi:Ca2+/Na+ antiporter